MSNVYSKNKKELAGATLIPASSAWTKTPGGKYKLRKDIDIVGKVDMAMPNMVLKANNADKRTGYVEDVAELPKRTKKEIVAHFFDGRGLRNSKKVAYIVRTDKQSKSKS